jgi:hypothetical protein
MFCKIPLPNFQTGTPFVIRFSFSLTDLKSQGKARNILRDMLQELFVLHLGKLTPPPEVPGEIAAS